MGRLLTSHVSQPAHRIPIRVSTHARTAGTTHESMTGQWILYDALCVGSKRSCELLRIILTALTRTAQWAGFFVHARIALVSGVAYMVLSCTVPGVRDLP